jgi:hypothetical protein
VESDCEEALPAGEAPKLSGDSTAEGRGGETAAGGTSSIASGPTLSVMVSVPLACSSVFDARSLLSTAVTWRALLAPLRGEGGSSTSGRARREGRGAT